MTVNQSYLIIGMYDQYVSFESDEKCEIMYIKDHYKDWIIDDTPAVSWHVKSVVDLEEYNLLKKINYSPYIIFRACPAHISFLENMCVIYCDDIFENYILVVKQNEHQILVVKKCVTTNKREIRIIGHIINEIIALNSYFKGYKKVHAAACQINGKGVLIQGEKRAGKTTLLTQLLINGALFLNNDITRIFEKSIDDFEIYAWPSKVNIGLGTLNDCETLKENLLNISPDFDEMIFNPDDGKWEFSRNYFVSSMKAEKILTSKLTCIIKPCFSINNKKCIIEQVNEFDWNDILSPICDTWLPIIDSHCFDIENNSFNFKTPRIPIYKFEYGPSYTNPGKYICEFISRQF